MVAQPIAANPSEALPDTDATDLPPASAAPRVLLLTEGTYPCHWGGVSTWCHTLTHELSDVEFVLVAVVRDQLVEQHFELAPNVVEFRALSLWDVRNAWELRPEGGIGMVRELRARTTGAAVRAKFLPFFTIFLRQLLGARRDDAELARAIHGMHLFFLEHDFDAAFRSLAVWDCFGDEVVRRFPRLAARHGYPGTEVTLADLTAGLHWLHHWFFPLSEPLPRADIVHATSAGICTLLAAALKLEDGSRVVLSEHGIYLRERYLAEHESTDNLFGKLLKLRFARRMTELAYSLADVVAPCCDDNRRWELRNGATQRKLRTTYYGVDPSRFAVSDGHSNGAPVVAWAGRFHPLKDVETLLRAAALVRRSRPEVRFRLFGSAQPGTEWYFERCQSLHRELHLGEQVTFEGFRRQTDSALGDADLVVLSSISEGFPFTTLEAMMSGKPVVATAVGGLREQVPPACGLTVEPRDPEAMASAILTVLADPDACAERGRAARMWVESAFSLEQFRSTHRAIYELLGRSSDGRVRHQPRFVRRENGSDWAAEGSQDWASLTAELAARVPQPVDSLELAAVLESLGITDTRAAARYGARNTFELAERAYAELMADRPRRPASSAAAEVPDQDRARQRPRLVGDSPRGLFALLPLLLLLGTIRVFANAGWDGGRILALSLGMTLGMVGANAVVHAVSRRTAIYLGSGYRSLAQRLMLRTMLSGAVSLTALGIVAYITLTAVGAFAADERLIFSAALVSFTAVWLVAASLSLARATGWVSVGLAAGLLAALAAAESVLGTAGLRLVAAAGLGVVVAIAVMIGAQLRIYGSGGEAAKLPSRSHLLVESGAYFAYGAGVMFLLLEPHLLAWFGADAGGLGRLQKIAAVEVAFTLAIPPVILATVMAERTLQRFWLYAKEQQRDVAARDRLRFGSELRAFYTRDAGLYLAAGGVLAVLMLVAVEFALRSGRLAEWVALPSPGATEFIFVAALVSFWLVGWAQFNCMFVLNLARPEQALRPVLAGMAVATLTGIPLAFAGFEYSALAFVAGSATFALWSLRTCRRVLADADHHYAAAF